MHQSRAETVRAHDSPASPWRVYCKRSLRSSARRGAGSRCLKACFSPIIDAVGRAHQLHDTAAGPAGPGGGVPSISLFPNPVTQGGTVTLSASGSHWRPGLRLHRRAGAADRYNRNRLNDAVAATARRRRGDGAATARRRRTERHTCGAQTRNRVSMKAMAVSTQSIPDPDAPASMRVAVIVTVGSIAFVLTR